MGEGRRDGDRTNLAILNFLDRLTGGITPLMAAVKAVNLYMLKQLLII